MQTTQHQFQVEDEPIHEESAEGIADTLILTFTKAFKDLRNLRRGQNYLSSQYCLVII